MYEAAKIVDSDMTAIEQYISWFFQTSQQKIENLKKIKKPSIGWISVYTPEEVIYAAGAVPFRITGEEQESYSMARAALFSNMCPYTLSCLEEGIQGIYNFSKGVVIVNTCDARRRLYDAWRYFVNTPFVHLLDLPKFISFESKDYFRKQIILFIKALENYFGRKITDDSLKEAIYLCNKTRGLLNKLYDFRKRDNLSITGAQALKIVKAGMSGVKQEFNEKLEGLVNLLETREIVHKKNGLRVLLSGSYFDQVELIECIENSGAIVVCEDLSNGIKYFEGKVDFNKDPVTALTDYYLEKAPCARMIDSDKRFNHIWKLIEEYNVDGVIYFSLKFCSTNLIDFPYLEEKLKQRGISVLFLEGERTLINFSQLKTRIQAFIEMLGEKHDTNHD